MLKGLGECGGAESCARLCVRLAVYGGQVLLQRAKGYSHVIGDALERFLARTYRGKNVAFAWGKAVLFRECRKVLVRSAFIGGSFGSRFFLGLGGLHLRGSELRQL